MEIGDAGRRLDVALLVKGQGRARHGGRNQTWFLSNGRDIQKERGPTEREKKIQEKQRKKKKRTEKERKKRRLYALNLTFKRIKGRRAKEALGKNVVKASAQLLCGQIEGERKRKTKQILSINNDGGVVILVLFCFVGFFYVRRFFLSSSDIDACN